MSTQSPESSVRHRLRVRSLLVALACLIVIAGIFSLWTAFSCGATHHVSTTGQPANLAASNCAHAVATEPAGANWMPITSTSPSDIAAMESDGLAMNESRLGPLTLDTPALVYPLNMRTGYDANDCPHWVTSYHSSDGSAWGVMDYVFDPSHSSIRFSTSGTIFPGDSRFGKAFPYVTLDQALTLLRQQRHIARDTRNAPMLVFFALKQGWAGTGQPDPSATHVWIDSGAWATDPVWRIVGADGKVYFVGEKQRVYAASEVPMA